MPARDEAAYARNWWSILLIDAGLGVVAAAFGLWRWLAGSEVLGGALVAAGLVYVVIVFRRFLRWRDLRSRADRG
jgi:hypothetical protein